MVSTVDCPESFRLFDSPLGCASKTGVGNVFTTTGLMNLWKITDGPQKLISFQNYTFIFQNYAKERETPLDLTVWVFLFDAILCSNVVRKILIQAVFGPRAACPPLLDWNKRFQLDMGSISLSVYQSSNSVAPNPAGFHGPKAETSILRHPAPNPQLFL